MALSKSILIVDDDIELGALLAEAVGDMSDAFTVKLAGNVDEAMVHLRRAQTAGQAFDLLITDIKMSGLSGLELLEALQSIAPGTKAIAMTAFNAPEIAGRTAELGAYAYLTKPFALSEFRETVRETLDAPLRAPPREARRAAIDDLSPSQHAAVTQALGALRAATGADAALIVRRDGAVVALNVLGPPRPIDDLGAELQATLSAITDQMTRTFDQDAPVRQSYFGTAAQSICTYRIDDTYTAAVVFGPAVRQGQVWYYLREAAKALESALDGQAPPLPPSRELPEGDVFDLFRRFFPEATRPAAAPGVEGGEPSSSARENAAHPSTPSSQEAQAAESAVAPPPPAAEAPLPSGSADQPALEDLDWDVDGALDWDAVIDSADTSADGASNGLTLDQARKRGLIGDIDAE